jgi:type VI secretion system protein ImpH
VIDRLLGQPEQFEFFQAVRLLEWYYHRGGSQRQSVGKDVPPRSEVVRFRALPALSFPGCAITSLKEGKQKATAPDRSAAAPLEMVVTFLGLTGPSGVLPEHYTTLILERMRQRDHALREFFDLFNHRVISHFYRAWEKYRFPFAYERCCRENAQDLFTECLYALVGFGTGELRGRIEPEDATFLFFAGHFAHHMRSAAPLRAILSDYFRLPIEVQQYCGQWLVLDEESRSRLAHRDRAGGQNSLLGMDVVLGERIWDVQSKFRLCLGPLTYQQFRRFMPSGDALLPLAQLTRSYVGPEFDFDVQLVLDAGEVPRCRLGSTAEDQPRLGWNTWLGSQPRDRDASDAIFMLITI